MVQNNQVRELAIRSLDHPEDGAVEFLLSEIDRLRDQLRPLQMLTDNYNWVPSSQLPPVGVKLLIKTTTTKIFGEDYWEVVRTGYVGQGADRDVWEVKVEDNSEVETMRVVEWTYV